jgi:hypothetical protein
MTNRNALELLEGQTGQLASFNYDKQKVTHLANEVNSTTIQIKETDLTLDDLETTEKVLSLIIQQVPEFSLRQISLRQVLTSELPSLKEELTKTKTKEQTPTVVYVQTKEQTSTNSNPLANCTPEDFDSAKKVLKAALKELSTDETATSENITHLTHFLQNKLPKLEKQADALLKEELINQTKNRFNLLLERASSSTDVSVIYKALDLIDSLAYPNFEWDTTQVNLLYKKLND